MWHERRADLVSCPLIRQPVGKRAPMKGKTCGTSWQSGGRREGMKVGGDVLDGTLWGEARGKKKGGKMGGKGRKRGARKI